jgi:hypothetical protein
MQPNPDPVWLLFRRRTFSRLAYWFQALGFNLRDHSLTNLLYFVYFCAFWLVWIVAVFALLGSALVGAFEFFPGTLTSTLATLMGAFILAAWGLIEFWRVTGRSPFVFSEPDAYLLCQTPANRRSVGMAWFLMDWFGTAILFAAGAILLSFALEDVALSDTASFQILPTYFASSLRALAISLPLQMGMQAGLYGLGALRLRRDRPSGQFLKLRWVVFPLGLCLMAALFFPNWMAIVLTPLTFPLQAAFGDVVSPTANLVRAGQSLIILALGMAGLLICADRMHLGRAAQETRLESIIRQARNVMNYELIEILQSQSKMGVTHSSSRLPARNGVWMLIWKDLVQSWRSLRASKIVRWIWVFLLSMGIFLSSGWVVQLILGVIWAVSLGSLTTNRLRSNLARWWLLRSLPFRTPILFIALLSPACVLGILLSWLALVLTGSSLPFGWLAVALLPFLVACAALSSAHDIIDHAKARVLITPGLAEENVPHQDIQGVLTILISVGFPLGLLTWGSSYPGGIVWALLSLPVAILITILLFQSVLRVYRWII